MPPGCPSSKRVSFVLLWAVCRTDAVTLVDIVLYSVLHCVAAGVALCVATGVALCVAVGVASSLTAVTSAALTCCLFTVREFVPSVARLFHQSCCQLSLILLHACVQYLVACVWQKLSLILLDACVQYLVACVWQKLLHACVQYLVACVWQKLWVIAASFIQSVKMTEMFVYKNSVGWAGNMISTLQDVNVKMWFIGLLSVVCW